MWNDVMKYEEARDLLLSKVAPVGRERVPLTDCAGKVLAEALTAAENVPPFDRSPYDGYALSSKDTEGVDETHPVILRILEEVPAGVKGKCAVTSGTAIKVLTGTMLPEGADCVVPFEDTRFTAETVEISGRLASGSNVIRAGEDVRAGDLLAAAGTVIDGGLAATLAGQNVISPEVYRVPRVGIISTGSELVEPGDILEPGRIYNTSRYAMSAVLRRDGAEPVFIGTAPDDIRDISELIREGLSKCDALVLTGGVSVGDYDLTPDAMELSGVEILFRGVAMKPGMACCYGMAGQKPVMALSGNPASSMTNYCAIARPAVLKLRGLSEYLPREIELALAEGFSKKSKTTRILRGRLGIQGGRAVLHLPSGQGNTVISSMIGCDAMAVVPAGSGALPAGTVLKGFLI